MRVMRDAPSHCPDSYIYIIVLDLRHSCLQTLSSILTTMLIQVYKYLILPWGIVEVVLDFTDGCNSKPLNNCWTSPINQG